MRGRAGARRPAVFEPAASEWIARARPHLHDRPERARELLLAPLADDV